MYPSTGADAHHGRREREEFAEDFEEDFMLLTIVGCMSVVVALCVIAWWVS